MLNQRFQAVDGLVNARLRGLTLGHFLIEAAHLLRIGRGQGGHPGGEQRFLRLLVGGGLLEGRDVPGEGFAQVVNDAHADHLVHVRIGELVAQEEGHQRHHPAVFCHAFVTALGCVAVAGGVLEALGDGEGFQQLSWIHGIHLRWEQYTTFPWEKRCDGEENTLRSNNCLFRREVTGNVQRFPVKGFFSKKAASRPLLPCFSPKIKV